MFPLRDRARQGEQPIVTVTIVFLIAVIFFWDRQWQFWPPDIPNIVFADLVLRPTEVFRALAGGDRFPIATLFTAIFLHGNWAHMLGNVLFLLSFGPSVEATIGSWRFALYFLAWGVLAFFAQIYAESNGMNSILGASGAIGGVLGAYFLLFPTSIFEFDIPIGDLKPIAVPAWVLLGGWFLYQVLLPQPGVANWAHVGGFLAGMVTVLIIQSRPDGLAGQRVGWRGAPEDEGE